MAAFRATASGCSSPCGSSAAVWVFDTFSWDADRADLDEPVSRRAADVDAEFAGAVAGRPHAARRQRRQQRRRRRRRQQRRAQLRRRLHPDRVVSDRRGFQPRRQADFHPERQGFRARRPNMPTCGMEKRLLGVVSIVPTPDRTTLARVHAQGLALTPYTRRHAADAGRASRSVRRFRARSAAARRSSTSSTSSARTAPTIRCSAICRGQRRSELDAVRPRHHAERPRARAELRRCSTTSTSTPTSATTATRSPPRPTRPTSSRRCGRPATANRGGLYLGEGGGFMRNPFGNITAPQGGYIWDYARRADVSVRSYGEFVEHTSRSPTGDVVAVESVPGLTGLVAPTYRRLGSRDHRQQARRQLAAGVQPIRSEPATCRSCRSSACQRSHERAPGPARRRRARWSPTTTSRSAAWSKRSRSSVYWKDSAIFVVEDDAQAGPTMSIRTARCCSSPARSPSAAWSITPSTRRRACCGRSS